MAGLAATTAALARLQKALGSTLPPLGPGRLQEVSRFGFNPGELRMLTYAPADLTADRPLVVVLHGCGQTAEAYAHGAGWIDLADRLNFALVCPEQSVSNNPSRCFNWFEPADIRRGEGEVASILTMTASAAARFGADATRVFVTGLSAGGAMTSAVLAAYPEVFAGGGVVAGLPYGVAAGMSQALAAMFQDQTRSAAELGRAVREASSHCGPWPRIQVWHGDADATVKPSNADAIVRQWLEVHGLLDTRAEETGPQGWRSWRRNGVALVERRIIPGLGHGVPLSTVGPDGVGHTGPFLLEAGVSSTTELARFWGITDDARGSGAGSASTGRARDADPTAHRAGPVNAEPHAFAPKGGDEGVRAVINRALRAAGLMR